MSHVRRESPTPDPPISVPASGLALSGFVDGMDVDLLAATVLACPGVSDLVGDLRGGPVSYLPGRRVPGIAVDPDRVRVQIRARWGVAAASLLNQITAALSPLVAGRRVEITIADVDDPPPLASPPIGALTATGGPGERAL